MEKNFKNIEKLKKGLPAVLQLVDGSRVRTSKVLDFEMDFQNQITFIKTVNSIYKNAFAGKKIKKYKDIYQLNQGAPCILVDENEVIRQTSNVIAIRYNENGSYDIATKNTLYQATV